MLSNALARFAPTETVVAYWSSIGLDLGITRNYTNTALDLSADLGLHRKVAGNVAASMS